MVKGTILQSKMDILSANSRFAVQNDGTYKSRITRETCIERHLDKYMVITPLSNSHRYLLVRVLQEKKYVLICMSIYFENRKKRKHFC
jgi:hypothetical protein